LAIEKANKYFLLMFFNLSHKVTRPDSIDYYTISHWKGHPIVFFTTFQR